MRLIISVVLVLIFSLPAKSQSYNEILSHFEKHESENPDSALFYALQLKDAALNEYGLTREAKYFKALNTIGIQYFDHNEVSIAEHYFHTVFELISKHGKDSFPNTLSLTTDYLYYIQLAYHHQIDSAMFYADEMLRQDLKTDWGTGRERINSIVNVAFNFDTTAGYSSAKKYYHLALEKRIELFGQANAYLVSSLDSMLNLRKRDYNASARYLIYSAPDDQLPVDSLAKLAKEAAGQDDWTSIRYASLWKDATGATDAEISLTIVMPLFISPMVSWTFSTDLILPPGFVPAFLIV